MFKPHTGVVSVEFNTASLTALQKFTIFEMKVVLQTLFQDQVVVMTSNNLLLSGAPFPTPFLSLYIC